MSKVGTEGVLALLHERDLDHTAVVSLFAGMQDSTSAAADRLERVVGCQREYRDTLDRRGRKHRKMVEILNRGIDLGGAVLVGLRQVADLQQPANTDASPPQNQKAGSA